ncbi:MAG: type 1 glutamine amidotransferase [Pseudomonadota bacterium]
MSQRIGIIETGKSPASLEPSYGTYPEMGAALLSRYLPPFQWSPISVVEGEQLPAPHTYGGYLIMGSEFSANDAFPWVAALIDFVRDLATAQIPLVGICFGHQLIARAMGGVVTTTDWIVGCRQYQVIDATTRVSTISYHQDQVTSLPPAATRCMTSDSCPNAALSYADWACWTIQSHPEFSRDYMRALVEHTRGRPLSDHQADDALASLTNCREDVSVIPQALQRVFAY